MAFTIFSGGIVFTAESGRTIVIPAPCVSGYNLSARQMLMWGVEGSLFPGSVLVPIAVSGISAVHWGRAPAFSPLVPATEGYCCRTSVSSVTQHSCLFISKTHTLKGKVRQRQRENKWVENNKVQKAGKRGKEAGRISTIYGAPSFSSEVSRIITALPDKQGRSINTLFHTRYRLLLNYSQQNYCTSTATVAFPQKYGNSAE